MRVVRSFLHGVFLNAALIAAAHAQTVGTTIPVGSAPAAIAINPVTNKIYVANDGSNSVTIIDGATQATSTLAVGSRPAWIAVNPETNKIYVSNGGGGVSPSLMVVNGATGTVSSTSSVGDVGWTAINPVTNKVYVIRYGFGDEVNIILDERYVNTAATRSYQPVGIALNPYTNILYIPHVATGDIVAIDARVDQSVVQDNVNNYPPLLCPNGSGGYKPSPRSSDPDPGPCINVTDPVAAVTVNPVTDMIYSVSSGSSAQIAVIRGSTLTNPHVASFLSPPGVSGTAKAIAVNPVSNKVYAVFDNHVVIVNAGSGNAMTVIPVAGAVAVGINTSTNTIYVPQNNGSLKVIDGATNAVSATLSIPFGGKAIAVNPVTNVAYVLTDAGVSPITGAAAAAASIPLTTSITPLAGNNSGPSGNISITAGSSGGFAAPRRVYFQIDSTSGAWQAASGSGPYTASFSGLGNGSHTIRAFATNALDAPSIMTDVQNNPLVGMIAAYTFTVNGATKADPSVSLMSTPNPSTSGQSVTLTASVSGSAGAVTGTVDFRDGASSIAGCNAVALSSGSATCSTTALANGAHAITAVYSGNSSYNAATSSPVTQNVKANSTTALASSANPSTLAANVTFTATVTSAASVNGGTVDFRDGTTSLAGCAAVTVTAGSATCSTTTLTVGSHSITALYSGNATANASTSSALAQQVSKATASVALTSSSNPSTSGSSVTFSANVSGSAGAVTGSVTFREGTTALCSAVALTGGVASCSTSALAIGAHSIVADYSGDASYNAVTSAALSQTVNSKPTPGIALASSLNPSNPGDSVTFTATLSGSSGAVTGIVDFRDGATSIAGCNAVALSSGRATCVTSALASGAHSITAAYGGDSSYNPVTSVALTQTVKASATVAVASSSNPSIAGGSVTFTASVSGAAGVATGTVTFRDGATAICTSVTMASGSASCASGALAAGTHSITADYSGSTVYRPSTSSVFSQVVNTPAKANATVALGSSANPSNTGEMVTFTANVAGSAGVATGTVNFLAGGSLICSAVTLASGAASCATNGLAAGTHSITAEYSGSPSYNPATSAALSQGVSAPPAAPSSNIELTQSANPNPARAGEDVVFSLTVTNFGPDAATGVTVTDPIPSGAAFISASAECGFSSGTVTCNVGSLPVGSSRMLQIVVRAASAGSITNTASVSAAQPDPSMGNNTRSVAVTVNATNAPAPKLSNISTRGQVGTGNNVMIGGFIIGGSSSKTVALVATGPSLAAFGIANPLANPTLTLVRQSDQAVIASNDDWGSAPNAAQLQAAGFAPSNSLESAILINLPPGAYTALVSGAGGGTGVAIVAVYEVDNPEVPLVNISTRGNVQGGNEAMIGGFIIQGSSPQTVAIVGTGPSLAAYGIANPLENPTLTLVRQSDQAVVATNDNWGAAANAAQIQAAGVAPSDSRESAILVTLNPGAYTAILSGVAGGTGIGIIAVYAVQ